MRVTLKDIARRANVNFTLVSKYINKTPGVSIRPETRARIQKAIDELNYHPIAAARALRYGKSNTLGLVVGNLTNEYFAHYADAVIREAEKLGYRLLISVCRESSPEKAVSSLNANQVDGIICCGCFNPLPVSCPMATEQYYSVDSMKAAMNQVVKYLKTLKCRTMSGMFFSNPQWAEIFASIQVRGFNADSCDLPLSMDRRAEFLRRICREKPDAIFSTGWQTVNLLSEILDREFPGYDPVILCWVNCKGPFMKNPRIKGVILTSTLLSIKETMAALVKQIEGRERVSASDSVPSSFITCNDPEFKALEAESFSLT